MPNASSLNHCCVLFHFTSPPSDDDVPWEVDRGDSTLTSSHTIPGKPQPAKRKIVLKGSDNIQNDTEA
jgi:hypothetical protein